MDLFDDHDFVTRDHCGSGWTPGLVVEAQVGSLLVALAYFLIPLFLAALLWRRWRDVPAKWMVVLFVIFIFLCGLTHLTDFFVFRWPAYRLFTRLRTLTALVSIATAALLPRVISLVSVLKTPVEYEAIIHQRDEAHKGLLAEHARQQRHHAALRAEADSMRDQIEKTYQSGRLQEAEYQELRQRLHDIRSA